MKNIPIPCVLTIGKFEGIHLGHQALIKEVAHQAKTLGIASAIMIFEPHPYIFLLDSDYKPLISTSEREDILKSTAPIDYILYCPFDKNFAAQSPEEFCKFIFADNNAKLVIVGDNFRFGKNRMGDIFFMKKQAELYGANVQIMPPQTLDGQIISTTSIRELISKGKIKEAQQQLGFNFKPYGE